MNKYNVQIMKDISTSLSNYFLKHFIDTKLTLASGIYEQRQDIFFSVSYANDLRTQ